MKLEIEIDEKTLTKLVIEYLEDKLGNVNLKEEDVTIEVQSTQNFRVHTWEKGKFRARYTKNEP